MTTGSRKNLPASVPQRLRNLAVSAVKVGVATDRRAARAGAGDVNHVEIGALMTRLRCAQMKFWPGVVPQHVLHVGKHERTPEQRIIAE